MFGDVLVLLEFELELEKPRKGFVEPPEMEERWARVRRDSCQLKPSVHGVLVAVERWCGNRQWRTFLPADGRRRLVPAAHRITRPPTSPTTRSPRAKTRLPLRPGAGGSTRASTARGERGRALIVRHGAHGIPILLYRALVAGVALAALALGVARTGGQARA